MKTHELIQTLVRDARPVRRLPPPPTLALALVALGLLAVALGAAVLGPRPDLALRISDGRFLSTAALLLAACAAAALSAAILALPGSRGYAPMTGGALVALAIVIGLGLSRSPWMTSPSWPWWLGVGLYCAARALLVSLLPAAGGFWLLRHGASIHPALSGMLIGMATGALGTLTLNWSCDLDEPAHVLVWHLLLPASLLVASGAWLGRRWLSW